MSRQNRLLAILCVLVLVALVMLIVLISIEPRGSSSETAMQGESSAPETEGKQDVTLPDLLFKSGLSEYEQYMDANDDK